MWAVGELGIVPTRTAERRPCPHALHDATGERSARLLAGRPAGECNAACGTPFHAVAGAARMAFYISAISAHSRDPEKYSTLGPCSLASTHPMAIGVAAVPMVHAGLQYDYM